MVVASARRATSSSTQTDRQTDRQTDIHTYIHTYIRSMHHRQCCQSCWSPHGIAQTYILTYLLPPPDSGSCCCYCFDALVRDGINPSTPSFLPPHADARWLKQNPSGTSLSSVHMWSDKRAHAQHTSTTHKHTIDANPTLLLYLYEDGGVSGVTAPPRAPLSPLCVGCFFLFPFDPPRFGAAQIGDEQAGRSRGLGSSGAARPKQCHSHGDGGGEGGLGVDKSTAICTHTHA